MCFVNVFQIVLGVYVCKVTTQKFRKHWHRLLNHPRKQSFMHLISPKQGKTRADGP